MRTVIENGTIFDTDTLAFTGEACLVIEDGRIVQVGVPPPAKPIAASTRAGSSCCPA